MHARSKSVQTPAEGEQAQSTDMTLLFIQIGCVTVNSTCDKKIKKKEVHWKTVLYLLPPLLTLQLCAPLGRVAGRPGRGNPDTSNAHHSSLWQWRLAPRPDHSPRYKPQLQRNAESGAA